MDGEVFNSVQWHSRATSEKHLRKTRHTLVATYWNVNFFSHHFLKLCWAYIYTFGFDCIISKPVKFTGKHKSCWNNTSYNSVISSLEWSLTFSLWFAINAKWIWILEMICRGSKSGARKPNSLYRRLWNEVILETAVEITSLAAHMCGGMGEWGQSSHNTSWFITMFTEAACLFPS